MGSNKTFMRQYGLQLVLISVLLGVIVYALGRRSGVISAENTPQQIIESVITQPTLTPAIIETQVSELTDVSLSDQTFDLSEVPTFQEDSAISPALNPRTFVGKQPVHGQFQTYTVVRGDTPNRIALKFGISPESLLGGNPHLSEEAGLLQVDDELIILPVDGVLHTVQAGESLETISNLYGIDEADIIAYEPNNLEFPYRLYADTQILVPGAVREVFQWDPPTITISGGSAYWAGQAQPLIVGTGTFIRPFSGGRTTQGFWYGHPGWDVALNEGSAIYAADTGTVTYASWSPYCYGNLIVVNHGNGKETFYAHLSGFNVYPGQIVYKGNVIGYSGNTGCSSGPHIHIEVRVNGNRDDPTWWMP